MKFKFGMTIHELKKRTDRKYYRGVRFLGGAAKEVKKLKKHDHLVLMHLVRAANYLEVVNLKLENANNMDFLKFLNEEIEKRNPKAILAKKLFESQKSMYSPDALGNQTSLVKDMPQPDGLGYFPSDLETKEFHTILNEMLDADKNDEVAKILNQRTIVVRDGKFLKAIDFVDAFPELQLMAKELRMAKEHSKDKVFNEYLELQAQALEKADPMLDAKADKVWATLSADTKYEFTICRECYDEKLTKSIYENQELMQKLKNANITVFAKDNLGARVGIVNKKGTEFLNKLKSLIDISAKFMPYKDEYTFEKQTEEIPQTAVDVDVITLTGEEGAYRASLVLAQNLPNDDKLALQIGGGRRNVYHRQVRLGGNKKRFKKLISDEQFKYFNPEADHWAVICHENTHSLGPKSHNSLGKFSAILEEFKADMGMYAFLSEFVKAGYFTEEQRKQIILTSLTYSFLKGKPTLAQAHRTRSVMIVNRMIQEKAITFDEQGKFVFDFDKAEQTAQKMMAEVVRLQIDQDVKQAEEYINKWFVWTDEIDGVSKKLQKMSKMLNGYLIQPLADEMLRFDYEQKVLAK